MGRKDLVCIFFIFVAVFCTYILLRMPWRREEGFQDTSAKPKGIILELIGGLGNQLYIYSAGKVMQQELGVPIYLKLQTSAENKTVFAHTNTDYRPILFSDFQGVEDNDSKMANKVDARVENKFWDPWNTDSIPTNSDKYVFIPDQWYQHFPSMRGVIPSVRKTTVDKLRELYPDTRVEDGAAFIHVRRGDYTDSINNTYLLDMDYYNKALAKIDTNTDVKRYYILSDDIRWCRQQQWNTTKQIIYVDEPNEMKALYMMSQCKAGAIISNSTFSTWGAILGAYESGGTIVYPSKWLYGASTEFPADWIRI